MAKVYRKRRLSMLQEGDFKGYTIYAFGEVILVMIGILLALQVNNWNQSVRDRAVESKMLHSIQDNLEEDAITLDLAIARIQKTIDAIERIQHDATAIPEDSLAAYATRSGYTRAFVPVATAFELSKSSGKLDLIQNDSLALAIQRLYDQDYRSISESVPEWKAINAIVHPYMVQYQVFGTADFTAEGYLSDFTFPLEPDKVLALFLDENYRGGQRPFLALTRIMLLLHKDARGKNVQLRASIETYLQGF
ncbi:MAG: hypothetical protein KTR29_16745 [Rhodothermaceae bacterium]|nr:hypothetical protein [Rhodothermaceae bacterium]